MLLSRFMQLVYIIQFFNKKTTAGGFNADISTFNADILILNIK